MSDYQKYLYCILHPNYAFVASMLPPEEFGRHYNLGSSRFFHGQVVFAEVDNSYRNDYFNIDEVLKDIVPKADGSPKRTKFIKTYRVLEHIDLSAIKNLYITSVLGKVLELKPESQYDISHEKGFLRTYQEICPLRSVVLSFMDPPEFGEVHYARECNQGSTKGFLHSDRFKYRPILNSNRRRPIFGFPNSKCACSQAKVTDFRNESTPRKAG